MSDNDAFNAIMSRCESIDSRLSEIQEALGTKASADSVKELEKRVRESERQITVGKAVFATIQALWVGALALYRTIFADG